MTTRVTRWPARRVGDRLLCGRPAPGRGYCAGEIATVRPVSRDGQIVDGATLGAGFAEDPPGSHHWRMTERTAALADAAADARRGWRGSKSEKVALRRFVRSRATGPFAGDPGLGILFPDLPWSRACPVCNVVAEVTDAVL